MHGGYIYIEESTAIGGESVNNKENTGRTNSAKRTETVTTKGWQDSSSWSNKKAYMTMGQPRSGLNLQAK